MTLSLWSLPKQKKTTRKLTLDLRRCTSLCMSNQQHGSRDVIVFLKCRAGLEIHRSSIKHAMARRRDAAMIRAKSY